MSELIELIENSRMNEVIAQKIFDIEKEILFCQSSQELLQRLLDLIQQKFNFADIHLLLVDPTPFVYLSENNQLQKHKTKTHTISSEVLNHFHHDRKPFLTNQLVCLPPQLSEYLFEDTQSIALIPLIMENKLFGSLFFTDTNKERFHNKLGTMYLEQLGVKVSLCLSNAMIREQLERLANYDSLTGAGNRRLMEVTINDELIRQKRYKTLFSVLFIDCNKFKKINDTYGHDCGDKVLIYVATQLKILLRENDGCFRYAGDEFVITLVNQSYDDALKASQRLVEFFNVNPMPYQDTLLPITISCGAAESSGSEGVDDLLKMADQQLYLQKDNIQ
jgi:diguanylate cyclase (GGDEF)-like protein